MIRLARWGFAVVLLPLAACNTNPGAPLASTVPLPQTLPSVSAPDQAFIDQASSDDQFEISSAQLALERSSNPRTRGFAQKLLDDHAASSQRLMQLAQANGVVLPTNMGTARAAAYAAIANARGNFDREFLRRQVTAHQQAIATYQNEIDAGYNNDVKAFAQQTLPMLQEHLQIAQSGGRAPMRRPRPPAS